MLCAVWCTVCSKLFKFYHFQLDWKLVISIETGNQDRETDGSCCGTFTNQYFFGHTVHKQQAEKYSCSSSKYYG